MTWIALEASILAYNLAPYEEGVRLVSLAVGSVLIWIGTDILSIRNKNEKTKMKQKKV